MAFRPVALVGAAALALALVLYVGTAPGEGVPAAPASPSAAAAPAPSADTVDPGVHAELMRLKAAAEAAPGDVEAQLAFSAMALGAHRGAEAAAALERAVAADPGRRQPWLDLALAYGAAEDWDAVADASRRMLQRFPADDEAHYNLGAAHANASRFAEARAAWQPIADGDGELALQAQGSIARLAAMEAAPAPVATAAPPLSDPSAPLPAGHPPIPATSPASARPSAGGVEARVVDGGTVDPEATRRLVTSLAGDDG